MSQARVDYSELKPGLAGITEQTIPAMQRLCAEAVKDQRVRRWAEHVCATAGALGGNRLAEARAIFDFVRAKLKYVRDPSSMELLHDPRTLLERIEAHGWAAGDCDDHAIMTAALGHSIRLPIVYVVAGAASAPEHVYAAMSLVDSPSRRQDLLALDTAVPEPALGRHPDLPVYVAFAALPEDF